MRIALVVPGGVDPRGRERVIPALLWLVERLARVHDVTVFAMRQPHTPPSYELFGAKVISLSATGPVQPWPRVLPRLLRELRNRPVDLLHAFWADPEGTLAAIAGTVLRKPVVVHLAGGELVALPSIDYGGRLRWRSRLSTSLALRGADRVTAASRPMVEAAALRGVRATRVPLGVALDRWPPREPVRRAPGEGPARLLHVGSLNPVKDQATLLDAASILSTRGIDFRLDVVGEDTMDGSIQARAEALGLGGPVCFHGFLSHDELRPLAEAAHLLVLSSRHEAGPVAVLEAAAVGVPTVGTDVGHVRELAPDGAVAVPVGDAAALARGIQSLLEDEDRRLRVGGFARRAALEWDADRTACRLAEIYQELRGRPRRAVEAVR